jgi:hypothetical protein
MDIQWVILARKFKLNTDKTIDIETIFHHINVSKDNNKVDFNLIAKVNILPTEVGKTKELMLVISNRENEYKKGYYLNQYVIPSLKEWANNLPYITVEIENEELPYSGDYTFDLYVDKEYKNGETIGVSYREGL